MHQTNQNGSKLPKLKDLIMCDDIRKEDNGKLIFIGVYNEGNVIITGKMPYIFQKLSFIVKLKGGKGEFAFTAILKDPDDKKIISMTVGPVIFEDEKKDFTLFIVIASLKIEKKGDYSFLMKEQDKEEFIFDYKFPIIHIEK